MFTTLMPYFSAALRIDNVFDITSRIASFVFFIDMFPVSFWYIVADHCLKKSKNIFKKRQTHILFMTGHFNTLMGHFNTQTGQIDTYHSTPQLTVSKCPNGLFRQATNLLNYLLIFYSKTK